MEKHTTDVVVVEARPSTTWKRSSEGIRPTDAEPMLARAAAADRENGGSDAALRWMWISVPSTTQGMPHARSSGNEDADLLQMAGRPCKSRDRI